MAGCGGFFGVAVEGRAAVVAGEDVGGVAVEFSLGEDEEAGDEEGGGAGNEDVVQRAPCAGVE